MSPGGARSSDSGVKRGALFLGPLWEVFAFWMGFVCLVVLLPPTSAAPHLYDVLWTCPPPTSRCPPHPPCSRFLLFDGRCAASPRRPRGRPARGASGSARPRGQRGQPADRPEARGGRAGQALYPPLLRTARRRVGARCDSRLQPSFFFLDPSRHIPPAFFVWPPSALLQCVPPFRAEVCSRMGAVRAGGVA